MESSPIVSFSQLSFFPLKPDKSRGGFASPTRPWKQRANRITRLHCQKMYVPGFGEASPEAKAASNLHNFFTYIAVKIVLAQLESYNPEAYEELIEFLGRTSLNDGNRFCANLMRESSRHKALGMSILRQSLLSEMGPERLVPVTYAPSPSTKERAPALEDGTGRVARSLSGEEKIGFYWFQKQKEEKPLGLIRFDKMLPKLCLPRVSLRLETQGRLRIRDAEDRNWPGTRTVSHIRSFMTCGFLLYKSNSFA